MIMYRKPIKLFTKHLFCIVVSTVFFFQGCSFINSLHKPQIASVQPSEKQISADTAIHDKKSLQDTIEVDSAENHFSPAAKLVISACENYLDVNSESPKIAEVLTIMASLYYNARFFPKSRDIYQKIIELNPHSAQAMDAMRMIAQSFYEEKQFTEAQMWYRKISEIAPDGISKQEALARIAESIFKFAEMHEAENRYKEAAEQYERVALEFPDSRIADVALFNAGLAYEKQTEWTHAILSFQRIIQRYPSSKLIAKTQFRTARAQEKLLQWEVAAQTYLRVVAGFPENELAPAAMYNAGFCFENGEKFSEAAATFEKMASLFPDSEDAADVLFRAGEIYGRIKDWESVSRVNKLFTQRFGNDQDRIIQAQCMIGIALYMQNKTDEALSQLGKALSTYSSLQEPSTMNSYYAAKTTFTIGEIYHDLMKKVTLSENRSSYKKSLKQKSSLLDFAVKAYVKTLQFKILEWTTRTVCQLGQLHEDFATGIFMQERAQHLSLEDRISLELGIANAVEQYLVEKSLHYHEQNVKLSIKEKIEDKYVLQSRRKLTYLPYFAAENYLALVEIIKNVNKSDKQEGFALIAKRLQMYQKIAPFQEKAIDLFLKSLEMGSTYAEQDEYYKKSTKMVTGIAFTVGETYYDIVSIARDAPVPSTFNQYERFVYKTKLIKQVEDYESQALTNYLKALKISETYSIGDDNIKIARERIAELLFKRARCYDLLCLSAFNAPPYPPGINAAEQEEYKFRFEEIGLKFQEQAFDIYREVLAYEQKHYASGKYVTDAYVRLFQNFPDEIGVITDELVSTAISSGNQWKCTSDSVASWADFECNDSAWMQAHFTSEIMLDTSNTFSGSVPSTMWWGDGDPGQTSHYHPAEKLFFRRTFTVPAMPHESKLIFAGCGIYTIYLNGNLIGSDSSKTTPIPVKNYDLMGKVRSGKNIIAIKISSSGEQYGIKPLILYTTGAKTSYPKPPGYDKPLSLEEVRFDKYVFPKIANFEF
ncbi:MAG: tetratricopeptide repeat protein [Chitinispirillaceae bacterium]|nr:tetratricopeptide repeat protein [Chitinispirillaceae bacterium]